jgi:hypothetical protein
VTQLTEVLQISEGMGSTVLKGKNVINVPTARTHTPAAIATQITSIDDNPSLNVVGDSSIMIFFYPLSWVFLPYAARHLRAP